MEKQHIISIKKHYSKINELGFSLIEVSLAMVLLSSAMLFMWQTSKTENGIYLSREYSTIICQYLNAFDSYLEKNKSSVKQEVLLDALTEYLPSKDKTSMLAKNIKFYTTNTGDGLLILTKDNKQKESGVGVIFLGFRTAQIKDNHIYSYNDHIKIDLDKFPDIPKQDQIEVMAIIPKETSYVKRCLIDVGGEE
ncbi:type IV pilus modification PilV family protein [Escherichia coli]|uniref:type IV pilus modification PilV family protein n=1 Tax=Escherichia coli TaxID=562 RepID=UPI000BE1D690|nr:prepilin-type N-terminal cleavage/methylation domain-containing protein [Escherichia coli]